MLVKTCTLYKRLFLNATRNGLFCFQGHYKNRFEETQFQCQCHQRREQQTRSLINIPELNRTRQYQGRQLVGYTMEQMFEVVSDVENYHKFVPWCKRSIILNKSDNKLKADLIIGYPPINESYTSNVTLMRPYLVRAECVDGRIFEHMFTLWRFSPGLKREQQSCVVDFHITFKFHSALYSHLSNLFFDKVVRQMEGAFIEEVSRRHGPATLQPRNLLIQKS